MNSDLIIGKHIDDGGFYAIAFAIVAIWLLLTGTGVFSALILAAILGVPVALVLLLADMALTVLYKTTASLVFLWRQPRSNP